MNRSVVDRFLHYVSFDTTSSPTETERYPSSERQLKLANELVEELRGIGVSDAAIDSFGYVTGSIPENVSGEPTIGLIAHYDTSPAMPGGSIKPRIVSCDGGDIVLNEEKGIVMRADEFECLTECKGETLVVTDGTTLLGGDDKAGIAEIITAADRIINDSTIKHGKIKVLFTPDEEVGRGTEHFDAAAFGADFAYTVDGGAAGELEYENFNAASAVVTVRGVSIHPGKAKNKMINASLLAMEFNSMLPQNEAPEHTEGYEGFYHLENMSGECELARLMYIVRDHDNKKFNARLITLKKITDFLNDKYSFLQTWACEKSALPPSGGRSGFATTAIFSNAFKDPLKAMYGSGVFELELSESYRNMKEKILPKFFIVERAVKAMESVGITPNVIPIRGGTDGARLSYMGLPCPNIGTGTYNGHGRYECVSTEQMEKTVKIILGLVSVKAT